jgi:hypothetical protein
MRSIMLPLKPQDRRCLVAAAMIDERTVRRAYPTMRPATKLDLTSRRGSDWLALTLARALGERRRGEPHA